MKQKRNQRDFQQVSPEKTNNFEPVILSPLQVRAEEVGGDTSKLIKKFIKKVRKEEVLKPFYDKLMYYSTKSQKRRAKKLKSEFEWKQKNRIEYSEDDR
jgi:hypothetical protein